jgi:hypothetical protein
MIASARDAEAGGEDSARSSRKDMKELKMKRRNEPGALAAVICAPLRKTTHGVTAGGLLVDYPLT